MAESVVGYRFCPTDEELINYYLRIKIMDKTRLVVEEEISEINNIYTTEPMLLPSLAKIQLDHLHRPVWYFFSPKEYTFKKKKEKKKKVTKRTTGSGYWKVTGIDQKIRDKRGNGVEIGIKKTLVYYEGKVPNGVRSPWVMHEYHITSLPPNHKSTYVICQVMYKGEEGEISYGNDHLSESSHITCLPPPNHKVEQTSQEDSLFMKDLLIPMEDKDERSPWDVLELNMLSHNNFPNLQQQSLYCDDYSNGLPGGDFENVFRMQDNRNDYRPKKPFSGIIVDHSSDSDGDDDDDAESISAMSYQGTWSPVDSVGSSNIHFTTSCSSTDACGLLLCSGKRR